MHIETNNVNIANYFKQTAEAFEAKNPGVKVEIQVLENVGVRSHLLLSWMRPSIRCA